MVIDESSKNETEVELVTRQHGAGRSLFAACCTSALLALISVFFVLKLYSANLSVPLNYLGDAVLFLSKAKGLTQGDWLSFNSKIGMPFGADWRDFPMNLTLDSLCMLVTSVVTKNPAVMVNAQWLGGLAAAAAAMTYCLMRFRVSAMVAICAGIVYALQPYGFYRGISHLHSMYYLVPLLATGAIELALGRFERKTVKLQIAGIPLYLCIACVGIGLSYLYTAFFACFIFLVAMLLAYFLRRKRKDLIIGVTLVLGVCSIGALNMSSSLFYWLRHGANPSMEFKHAEEAEIYGLKIRFLLTPTPQNPIPALRKVDEAFKNVHFPFDTENESARLGTLGTIGFLSLLIVSLFGSVSGRWSVNERYRTVAVCAALTLACILLATVGGFGDFFNTFIASDIRCYNRISPFISFFALVPIALMAETLRGKIVTSQLGAVAFQAILLFVLIFALFDQPVLSGYLPHSGREDVFRSDDQFVKRIESTLPENSSIFELPYTEFPVEQLQGRMFNNDQGRPYIHAVKTRWSWGAISGTTSAEWNKQAASLAVPEMVHRLAHGGYSGIWVDLFGYKPDQSPERSLSGVLGVGPLRDPSGRFLFFDMRAYQGRLAEAEKLLSENDMKRNHAMQVTYERGLYSSEPPAEFVWSSGRHGRIVLINLLDLPRDVSLSFVIRTAYADAQKIRVDIDKERSDHVVAGSQSLAEHVVVAAKKQIAVDFYCRCKPFTLQGSKQRYYFGVQNLRIQE